MSRRLCRPCCWKDLDISCRRSGTWFRKKQGFNMAKKCWNISHWEHGITFAAQWSWAWRSPRLVPYIPAPGSHPRQHFANVGDFQPYQGITRSQPGEGGKIHHISRSRSTYMIQLIDLKNCLSWRRALAQNVEKIVVSYRLPRLKTFTVCYSYGSRISYTRCDVWYLTLGSSWELVTISDINVKMMSRNVRNGGSKIIFAPSMRNSTVMI